MISGAGKAAEPRELSLPHMIISTLVLITLEIWCYLVSLNILFFSYGAILILEKILNREIS